MMEKKNVQMSKTDIYYYIVRLKYHNRLWYCYNNVSSDLILWQRLHVFCLIRIVLSFSLFQMHLHILRRVSDAFCERLLWDGMDSFFSGLHNHAVW